MKSLSFILALSSFFLTPAQLNAQSDLPSDLYCRIEVSETEALIYQFTFQQIASQRYKVSILGEHLDLTDAGQGPVSSDDDSSGGSVVSTIIAQASLYGVTAPDDQNLIFFNARRDGFIRADKEDDATYSVMYVLPGQAPAVRVTNCLQPEGGVTVHN